MRSIRNVGFCVVMLLFVIGAQRGVFASRLLADNYYSNEFLNTHPECDNQDFVEFWVLVINYPPVWNGFYYACDDVNENGCWDEPWAYWDASTTLSDRLITERCGSDLF